MLWISSLHSFGDIKLDIRVDNEYSSVITSWPLGGGLMKLAFGHLLMNEGGLFFLLVGTLDISPYQVWGGGSRLLYGVLLIWPGSRLQINPPPSTKISKGREGGSFYLQRGVGGISPKDSLLLYGVLGLICSWYGAFWAFGWQVKRGGVACYLDIKLALFKQLYRAYFKLRALKSGWFLTYSGL